MLSKLIVPFMVAALIIGSLETSSESQVVRSYSTSYRGVRANYSVQYTGRPIRDNIRARRARRAARRQARHAYRSGTYSTYSTTPMQQEVPEVFEIDLGPGEMLVEGSVQVYDSTPVFEETPVEENTFGRSLLQKYEAGTTFVLTDKGELVPQEGAVSKEVKTTQKAIQPKVTPALSYRTYYSVPSSPKRQVFVCKDGLCRVRGR